MPGEMSPRPRRRRARGESGERVDMTAMIDVVFLLLVFFLCATQFRRPEAELETWLPRDRGIVRGGCPLDPGCRVTLAKVDDRILCTGDQVALPAVTRYGSDPVGRDQEEFERRYGLTGPDLGALETHLRSRQESYRGSSARGLPVSIDCDGDVPSRYVVDVVDICRKLGIEEIRFAAPEEPWE